MKKTYLWVLALALCIAAALSACSGRSDESTLSASSESQQTDASSTVQEEPVQTETAPLWLLTRERTSYSGSDQATEILYTYSPEGRLLVKQEPGGISRVEIYEYNDNGQISRATYEWISSEDGSYREIVYREDGTVLYTIFRNSDGTEHSRMSATETGFYSGTTYSVTVPGWSDPSTQYTEYEYDEKGNVVEERSYYDGALSSTIAREFDSHNNPVRELVDGEVAFGGEFTYEYEYNTEGQIIYSACRKDGELYTEMTRTDSDSGYTEESFCYMIEYDHSISSYTSDGKLLECISYGPDDSITVSYQYVYDEAGNMIQKTMNDKVTRYEYTTDSDGNIVEKKEYTNGTELYSTTEYSYARF